MIKSQQLSREEAIEQGFAPYNLNEHVTIEADENVTISIKTKNGSMITCALIIGEDYDICMDVKLHNTPKLPEYHTRNANCTRQEWILFNGGAKTFVTSGTQEKACTSASLKLTPSSYQD